MNPDDIILAAWIIAAVLNWRRHERFIAERSKAS